MTWLADLENVYPGVVFDAYVDGRQELRARVFVDGEQIADHIDGAPVPIDPGRHVVRIEVPRFPPNEQVIVVPEKEHRVVAASFASEPPSSLERVSVSAASRRVPSAAWVAGGVAIAGVAFATAFGVLALSEKNKLSLSCAPFCSADDVAPLRRDMLVTDLALGVVAVSTIAAAVIFLTRSSAEHRPFAISQALAPASHQGTSSLGVLF